MDDSGRKPLLRGRGMIRIEDFCASAGLDPAVVDRLIREGRITEVLWTEAEPTRPVGIFDDMLPSREDLESWGVSVSCHYEPDALRSHELSDDEDPDDR